MQPHVMSYLYMDSGLEELARLSLRLSKLYLTPWCYTHRNLHEAGLWMLLTLEEADTYL